MSHPFKSKARSGRETANIRYADGGSINKSTVRFLPEASFEKNTGFQDYRFEGRLPLTKDTDMTARTRLTPNEAGLGKHGYDGMVGISHRFKRGGKV